MRPGQDGLGRAAPGLGDPPSHGFLDHVSDRPSFVRCRRQHVVRPGQDGSRSTDSDLGRTLPGLGRLYVGSVGEGQ